MDFALTPEQQALTEAVGRVVQGVGDRYWLERDATALSHPLILY
ncbi:MAG: hypothetical protein ACRYF2_11780 [Janthinobacterium lividum]